MKYIITNLDGIALPLDEPVFVLRAQDKLAAEAVRFYARLVKIATGKDVSDILSFASEMEQWPIKKMPD